MDLLAQKRMLFILILLGIPVPLYAGEGFYQFSQVDYVRMKTVPQVKKSAPMLWTENGQSPPKAVVDLLNAPCEATAREYLAWSRRRMQMIKAAQDALDKAERSMRSTKGDEP